MLSKKVSHRREDGSELLVTTAYGSRAEAASVPKYALPEQGLPAALAYQIIHDELNLDGNPALNLASFVTTWMEPEADRLIVETLNKNLVDEDEYPQTIEIQNRCVNILARLFHAPDPERDEPAVGTATVGSSEAIHLAGLALKWNWRTRRQAQGLPADRPNLVMGHNVQVCWEKFARYFEVEPRYVPLTRDRCVLGVAEALERIDENTIGVVGILGSTYTGQYEPIAALNEALDHLHSNANLDVPIHVDAASGGFVAPFLQPRVKWDFRLPRVKSINVSGHKYGLVYPGVGWVVWRDRSELPEDLIFHVNYLGGDQPTFNLNFSRGASPILAQYYNFLRLGREGYRRILENLSANARYLSEQLQRLERFRLLSDGESLPLVCAALVEDRGYSVFDLSARLRQRGWIVPAYTMAPNAEDLAVLRVVLREGFTRDMAEMLLADVQRAIQDFESARPLAPRQPGDGSKTKGVC